jgi:hypothetical protein
VPGSVFVKISGSGAFSGIDERDFGSGVVKTEVISGETRGSVFSESLTTSRLFLGWGDAVSEKKRKPGCSEVVDVVLESNFCLEESLIDSGKKIKPEGFEGSGFAAVPLCSIGAEKVLGRGVTLLSSARKSACHGDS